MIRRNSNQKSTLVLALGLIMMINPARAAYDTYCSAGYWLSNSDTCIPSSPGYYAPGGRKTTQDACPGGTYSGFAADSCTTCPAGYYCPEATGAVYPCASGDYSSEGSTSCSGCPNGYTCNEQGLITPCPAGMMCSWSSTIYAARARSCYAGYYCYGGQYEVACPTGTYSQMSTTGTSACTKVPAGYGYTAADHPPIQCPAGYYQDAAGSNEGCIICPTGHYCPGGASGYKAPQMCDLGYFAPIAGHSTCHACPQGHYCQVASSWPTACPYGYFSDDGQYECTLCPAGMQCIGGTSSGKSICTDGWYSMTGDGVCTLCPGGYRCQEKHMKPLKCLPGEYSYGGAMICTICPFGHKCTAEATTPAICPQGMSAPQGSYFCSECPTGYSCNNAAATDALRKVECDDSNQMTTAFHDVCQECPAGYACPLQLFDYIEMCGPGFFSFNDMDYCQVQFAGSYSPTTQTSVVVDSGHFAEIGMTYQTRVFPNKNLKTTDGRHTIACKPGQYLNNYVCTNSPAGTFSSIAYSVSGHRTAGLDCPDGMWSLEGSVECHVCRPGFDCTSKGVIPATACADGYYQIGGNMVCTICPDGHECNKGETLISCPLWHYADSSTLGDCLPCPDGYDCTTGVKVGCPAGTYSSAQDFTCNTCPQGYYCPALSGFPTANPGGTFSSGGASAQSTCPTDYYSEEGNAYCTPVPPGFRINDDTDGITVCLHKTYSDWGQTVCSTCPNGYLCPEKTQFATSELSCPRGSYCVAGVQTLCPQGYFGIKERGTSQADACSACPSGYNCIAGTEHFQLAPCPLGAYCPDGVYTVCPAGTTGDTLYGQSLNDCKTCAAGTSCGEGSTTLTTCGQEYYCPQGSEAPGFPCPPGTFGGYKTGKTDPSECLICPPGYYCEEGTTDPKPTPTPQGYYNPLQGIDSLAGIQICPPKFYCPDEGMTNYLGWHCAAGHYCPAGSISATGNPCPAGTYSDRVNLHDVRHCLSCPRGFTCAEGTTSSNGLMIECTVGEFCDLGSAPGTTAIQCPAGTYSPFTKSMSEQDCLPCTPGNYCIKSDASELITCPVGYYCPLGTQSATQYPCPQGTYSTQGGLLDVNQCASCGVGFKCPTAAMAAPTACEDGYYNDYDVRALYCDVCPAGHTCNSGDDHPQPCLEGYYADRGQTACSRCDLGHFCPIQGTTLLQMISWKCPAGTFCSATIDSLVGGLGSYPNKESQANGGNACSKYYYCPEGTTEEVSIPTSGYVTILIEGAGYLDEGINTPPGYVDQQMTVCPAGYYCSAGTRSTAQAVACPKGTYRGDIMGMDISDCGLCPSGYYCPIAGTSIPTVCPKGKFCPEGASRASDCPLGTFNDVTGIKESRECQLCPSGYYCPLLGQTIVDVLQTCDQGFVCYGGAYRPEPTDKTTGDICPAGAYCEANVGLQYCAAGTIGIFQGAFESSACKACEKGFYCFGGDTGAVTCPAGYYCPEGSSMYDQDSQKPPPGFYNIAGQEEPTKCALGTFTKVLGQSSCTNCEQGFYCHTIGLADPETNAICPTGHYCPSYDVVTSDGSAYRKLMCPAGTYQPDVSMTSISDCLACPAGKACEFKAIIDVAADLPDCAAGFFCVTGASSRYPYTLVAGEYGPCPVGYWCDVGTEVPTACVAGYFSNQERAISIDYCLVCPPGFMCELDGLAEPTGPVSIGIRTDDHILENVPCSAYSSEYCSLGTFIAQQCFTGYYQDVASQGKCKECPAGQYCLNGSPINCLAGYYCP